jgi:hypothetical protein
MLENFKPVAFEPYGRRRLSWRPPLWLLTLLLGAAVGVGGLMLVQERFLPSRLSSSESAALRNQVVQTEQERDRAKVELAASVQQRDAALAERKAAVDELAADRERTMNTRADQDFLIASLPPDPRAGAIEVRAARLTRQRGALNYEVLLMRGKGANADVPLPGVMQFVVAGQAGGVERHLTLEPIKITVGTYLSLRGSVSLPETFNPKQTTINVLDRVGGKQLGMRVIVVG